MAEPIVSSVMMTDVSFRNLDIPALTFPLHALVVMSGRSGAGKSTLLRDILFAEARRRYQQVTGEKVIAEKCFLGSIRGLPFSLLVHGKARSRNWVPSVLSESGMEKPFFEQVLSLPEFCPNCHSALERQTPEVLRRSLQNLSEASRFLQIEIPFEDMQTLEEFSQRGFSRARVGEEEWRIEELFDNPSILANPQHQNDRAILYDRVPLEGGGAEKRLFRALRELGEQVHLAISLLNEDKHRLDTQRLWHHPFCRSCQQEFPALSPSDLSPRSRHARCPECLGAGVIHSFSEALLIADDDLPIVHGGFRPFLIPSLRPSESELEQLFGILGVSEGARFSELSTEKRHALIFGKLGNQRIHLGASRGESEPSEIDGNNFVALLRAKYRSSKRTSIRAQIERFLREDVCPECEGSRLRKELGSRRYGQSSLKELCLASVGELPGLISEEMHPALRRVIDLLSAVGLSYIPLSQSDLSLSNGERQRIRLIRGIVAQVSGVLYLLDEPLGGLFPSDRLNVRDVFRSLLAEGNSILAAENDPRLIEEADFRIVLGPGGGMNGGKVVSLGRSVQKEVANILIGTEPAEVPSSEQATAGSLNVRVSRMRNLKEIDLHIPLGKLTLVAGPSGSGKTTLVREVMVPLLKELLQKKGGKELRKDWAELSLDGECAQIYDSTTVFGKLSSRSTVASYSHLFSALKDLYRQLPNSKISGDLTLSRFQGKSLADALELTVAEALKHFRNITYVARLLKRIDKLGLSYLRLNQATNSLSEGELQRLSLMRSIPRSLFAEMAPPTILVCDEPARGLRDDEALEVGQFFRKLTRKGHTVILIEHHLSLLAQADYLIELGPGAGPNGGKVIFEGEGKKIREAETSRIKTYLEQTSQQ